MLVLCWIARWVPYRKQELLTLHDHLDPPPGFGAVRVAHPFSFLFLCFALSSSCVLCAQCCQFLWIINFWLLLHFALTFISKFIIRQTFSTIFSWKKSYYDELASTCISVICHPKRIYIFVENSCILLTSFVHRKNKGSNAFILPMKYEKVNNRMKEKTSKSKT